MVTRTLRIPALKIETDVVEMTSFDKTEPDPNWKYRDKEGHTHVWRKDKGDLILASLVYVIDYVGDDEHPASGHYECRRCRAPIEPGYQLKDSDKHVKGLSTYFVDDAKVTKEYFKWWMGQLERLCEAWRKNG